MSTACATLCGGYIGFKAGTIGLVEAPVVSSDCLTIYVVFFHMSVDTVQALLPGRLMVDKVLV